MPDITSRQEAFALAVARPGSTLSGAYREAYNAENMTPASVWAAASALAANRKVTIRITELREQAAQLAGISSAQVLEQLAFIAFRRLSDVVSWDAEGNLHVIPSDRLPPEAHAALKSVRRSKDGTLTVELESSLPALIAIGRHLGMFPTRVEQTGKDGGPIDIEIKALVAILDAVGLTPEQEAALDRAIDWQQGEG